MHPKTSGIGAVLLVLFVLAGTFGDSGQETKQAAASRPTTSAVPSQQAAATGTSPAPTPASSTPRSASPSQLSAAPVDRTQQGSIGALALLATVTIKGRTSKTGYDRDQFGAGWSDDNNDVLGHNGCGTRTIRTSCEGLAHEGPSNWGIRANDGWHRFKVTRATNSGGTS